MDEEEIWLTFNQWKTLNYRVMKGEKSTKRDSQGRPLFSLYQVDWDDHDEYYPDTYDLY